MSSLTNTLLLFPSMLQTLYVFLGNKICLHMRKNPYSLHKYYFFKLFYKRCRQSEVAKWLFCTNLEYFLNLLPTSLQFHMILYKSMFTLVQTGNPKFRCWYSWVFSLFHTDLGQKRWLLGQNQGSLAFRKQKHLEIVFAAEYIKVAKCLLVVNNNDPISWAFFCIFDSLIKRAKSVFTID